LVQESNKRGLGFTPCAICGVLRRHGMMSLALDIKADFIAMGNTLEDEAETILLNIIRGNLWKNYRDKIEYKPADRKSLLLRIKPLSEISEKTIRNNSKIHQLPILKIQCAFTHRSLRSEIAPFLIKMDKKDPHILYNIVSSIQREKSIKTQVEKVYKCKNCSSYSSTPEYSACRMIQTIINYTM